MSCLFFPAWNKTVLFYLYIVSVLRQMEKKNYSSKALENPREISLLNPLRQSRVSGSDWELKAKRGNNNMLFAAC